MPQFRLVLLIRLREIHQSSESIFNEFLKPIDRESDSKRKYEFRDYVLTNIKDILVLIDGLDEYKDGTSEEIDYILRKGE